MPIKNTFLHSLTEEQETAVLSTEGRIRSGKFLEDYPYESFEMPYAAKNVVIFNVSEFLLGHAVEPSHKWCDVFYDDFADLKD